MLAFGITKTEQHKCKISQTRIICDIQLFGNQELVLCRLQPDCPQGNADTAPRAFSNVDN